MRVGHSGQRAENAGSSGALSSRTMIVTMTAKTASEYVARRCAPSRSSPMMRRRKYGHEHNQVPQSRRRWIRRGVSRGRSCRRTSVAVIARFPDLEPHVSESDAENGGSVPGGRPGFAGLWPVRSEGGQASLSIAGESKTADNHPRIHTDGHGILERPRIHTDGSQL